MRNDRIMAIIMGSASFVGASSAARARRGLAPRPASRRDDETPGGQQRSAEQAAKTAALSLRPVALISVLVAALNIGSGNWLDCSIPASWAAPML